MIICHPPSYLAYVYRHLLSDTLCAPFLIKQHDSGVCTGHNVSSKLTMMNHDCLKYMDRQTDRRCISTAAGVARKIIFLINLHCSGKQHPSRLLSPVSMEIASEADGLLSLQALALCRHVTTTIS